jgi:hypothetical protein
MATVEEFKDIYDILPDVSIDYRNWYECERAVLNPALVAAGYQPGRWYTTESDSCGPLGRAMNAYDPEGHLMTICYG